MPLWLGGLAVHAFTASGTVLAFLMLIAAMDGNVEKALWLGLAALVVDGTDGMLARKFRVSETIPWFDGARLDDIVDYMTYTLVPIVLLWTNGYLPGGWVGWVLASMPLLASSYQFCITDAKTADHFFLGFPSYWNVVAFYVIVLEIGTTATGLILLFCAVMVFVPIRYLYPSRTRYFRPINLVLTAVWFVTYAILLLQLPNPHPLVIGLSMAYIVYYAGVSLYLTLKTPWAKAKLLRDSRGVLVDGSDDPDLVD
jgi:phosphatidylcholine synthase